MLRPPDLLRQGPLAGLVMLSACGHIGIDLGGDGGGGLDGTGAASLLGTGGADTGGADAAGGEPSSGGADMGGADSSGGSDTGGATGSGGQASGGADSGGTGGVLDCEGHDEPDFSLVGWATEAGGTTGGKGGVRLTVQNGAQLQQALRTKNPLVPLTVLVGGTITQLNTGPGANKIDVTNVSDVSIIGLGDRGAFDGIGLRVNRSSNIVIRNLRIHHVDAGEKDSISLSGPADHIWIDHCELDATFQDEPKGTYDGLIDIKDAVSHVTYSWNYIHDTWDPLLVGSTEMDKADRKLTMHHNRVQNVDSGAPSFRGGNGHIFNNLYEDVATMAINTRIGACLRIENNVFANVTNPWVSAFSPGLGAAELVCNQLDSASVFDFSAPDVRPVEECVATVPYDYSAVLNDTAAVAALVVEHAGYGKLDDPEDF